MAEAILSRHGIAAVRVTPHTQLLLQARPDDTGAMIARLGLALPETVLQSAATGRWTALHLAPDDWLLVGSEPDMAAALFGRLAERSGPACSLVDVSDRGEMVDISGTLAADLLAGGCPIDLATLGDGGCSYTLFGKATILLWQRGDTFRIGYTRSFDDYVTALLLAIADDLTDGFVAA